MKLFALYFRYLSIRLFYLTLAAALFFGSYFYTVPQMKIGGYILSNPIYANVERLPAWLYDINYFIFMFIVAIVIIFILIIYYNTNKRRKAKKTKEFLDTFVTNIFTYLFRVEEFTGDEKKEGIKTLNDALKSVHSKKLFINTLVHVHSQTEGIIKEKTNRLLKSIKYNYLIYAYLHSPYLSHKLFALKVIQEFELEGYDKRMLKLTKRKNDILHVQAIITLLKLRVYSDLLFLNDLKIRLTMWDINLIIKTIQEQNKTDINYTVLIHSVIPEVSALGLILARLHKRTELKNDVTMRIGNSNQLVNEEALLAFISFSDQQADYDFLIEKFNMATHKAQRAIIRALARSKDNAKRAQFLNWVVENQSYTQKTEAIRQLLELDLNAITRFKQSEDKLIRQSCLQVLDINL